MASHRGRLQPSGQSLASYSASPCSGVAYIADLRGLATFVTALGSVVWIAASIGGFMLVLDAIGGFMMELFSSDGSAPPFRFVVTIAGTGLLGLVLARWLPKVGEASADAFAPSERI